LTTDQIEVSPLPSPKLANIQKALLLYQERLVNSSPVSPTVDNNGVSLIPIASTSDELMRKYLISSNQIISFVVLLEINDNTSTTQSSSLPTTTATKSHDKLYDVDILIDSLDYERLYLNDEMPISTSQTECIHTRRHTALINQQEQNSPQKRCLSPTNEENEKEPNNQISPKKQTISNITLGERLQNAADIYKTKGILSFDDDYIALVRQLFTNSSLTHLEQLHLKTLFLNH
jgi:hypothetical protein